MGTGQKKNNLVVKEAAQALQNLKYEVSKELNIDTTPIVGDYWGYMTSRDCGAVGGHMVKRMIEAAERAISEQALANVKSGFQASLNNTNMSYGQPDKQVQTNPSLNLNSLDQMY